MKTDKAHIVFGVLLMALIVACLFFMACSHEGSRPGERPPLGGSHGPQLNPSGQDTGCIGPLCPVPSPTPSPSPTPGHGHGDHDDEDNDDQGEDCRGLL